MPERPLIPLSALNAKKKTISPASFVATLPHPPPPPPPPAPVFERYQEPFHEKKMLFYSCGCLCLPFLPLTEELFAGVSVVFVNSTSHNNSAQDLHEVRQLLVRVITHREPF